MSFSECLLWSRWPSVLLVTARCGSLKGRSLFVCSRKRIFEAMRFRSKGILDRLAFRALLFAICISIAFGSVAHVLLPSLSLARDAVANEVSPKHPFSVPEEETPSETPETSEPIKESEVFSFSQRRKRHKAARHQMRWAHLDRFSSWYVPSPQVLLVGSQTPSLQFENCYRNGCGAHLRC